jgi:penicillin-binding protein 1A
MLSTAGLMAFMYQEVKDAGTRLGTLPEIMDRISLPPSKIVTADGVVIYQASEVYRKPVKLAEVPKLVQNAVLAAEDKRFYDHSGVDIWALGRVLRENVREGRNAQGGSTLTMQLAKRLFTSPDKTFKRKFDDIALAMAIEQRLTKDQILELYLNQVYFGEGATGIKAAAEIYLNKSLAQVTVSDAAMLSRCVRRPSDQNPFKNLKKSIENRNVVLATMREEGMISESEYDSALKEQPKIAKDGGAARVRRRGADFFIDYVLEQIKENPALADVDLGRGGYTIETTLNYSLEKVAEEAVKDVVNANRRRGIGTGAFVLMDGQGQILCMVGGKSYRESQVNVITHGMCQPGSSFKPFMYASALRTGAISMNDSISNLPYKYVFPGRSEKPWEPKNSVRYDGSSASIRTAFSLSLNIPAARVMEKVGPDQVVTDARAAFGFTSNRIRPYMSLALGTAEVHPLEMAQAYTVFMLGGDRATPYGIRRIIGPDGEVMKVFEPRIYRGVFDVGTSMQVDELLRDVVTIGTGRKAGVVPNARGKTGTTQDGRDAWFCGYANGLVGIGWVGNYIPRPTNEVYGGQVTVNIWTAVMNAAIKKYGDSKAVKVEAPLSEPPVTAERAVRDDPEAQPDLGPANMEPANVPPSGDDSIPSAVQGKAGPVQLPTATPEPDPKLDPPRVTLPEPKVEERPRPVAPRREASTTEVEICADTGMRASIYCPETVVRSFPKGQEPRRRCTRHGS